MYKATIYMGIIILLLIDERINNKKRINAEYVKYIIIILKLYYIIINFEF